MTSKCGKNKKVAHEAIAEFITDASYASDPIELVDRGGHVLPSYRLLNLIEMPLIYRLIQFKPTSSRS